MMNLSTVRTVSREPRFSEFSCLGPSGFIRTTYVEWGRVDADRTVVCVHGLTRNSRDFDFLAQRLANAGMRVVAIDLPGRGRSEWVKEWQEYGTRLYLSALSGLIARLNVPEVDWIGTSLGGHIGMEFAALQGAPVRRLVLNDFGARVSAGALQRISDYLKAGENLRFTTLDELEAHLRSILAPFGQLSDAEWQHLARHSAVDAGGGRLRMNHDPAIRRQFWMPMLFDLSLWHVWDRVSCPTLIIRGKESDLLSFETVQKMKGRGIAASRGLVVGAEISDCGHAPALMADEQIRLIEDFLTSDLDYAATGAPTLQGTSQ